MTVEPHDHSHEQRGVQTRDHSQLSVAVDDCCAAPQLISPADGVVLPGAKRKRSGASTTV